MDGYRGADNPSPVRRSTRRGMLRRSLQAAKPSRPGMVATFCNDLEIKRRRGEFFSNNASAKASARVVSIWGVTDRISFLPASKALQRISVGQATDRSSQRHWWVDDT